MQPLCEVICTLLLSALLPWPVAGQFHVIGPAAPVIASVGKEAVLPCHLSPETDAEGMEVTWYKINPSSLVHHYSEFQDILEQQQPEYQNRTEFLKENITKGQVALKIRSIHISDDGEYSCLFASSTFEKEARFKVLVTGLGMIPHIHIEPGDTGEVKLTCTSMGWYPEPQVQWRELQGRALTPTSETKKPDGNGLFHVETSVTVNTGSKGVTCILRNPVLSEEKEARVSVSGDLFLIWWAWITILSTVLLIVLLLISCVQSRRKYGNLRKEIDFLKEENVRLTHFSHRDHHQDELKEENGDLRKKYDELKEENDKLKEDNGALHKIYDALRRKYDELKEENGALHKMYDALRRKYDALKRKYDALKKKYHDLMKVNGVSPEEQSSSSELLISLLQEESEETSGL